MLNSIYYWKKKQFIGKTVAIDSVISSVSFLISVILATYNSFFGIQGVVFKTIFVIMGIGFTIKSLYDIYKNHKNNYSYEDLLNDINKLNEISHNHSIIVFKDTFNEFSNKYLVYNDTKWDCTFFLNYKENINNESYIKEHLSNELKIPVDCINLKYVTSKIHEKYSESDKMNKIYSHKFYLADIVDFSEIMKKDVFEIDGRTYYWMSMSELESDQNVLKKNSDIISYIKEAF